MATQTSTVTLVDPPPLEHKLRAESAEFTSEPFEAPPTFENKYEERKYQKGRLALAFRIFAKLGFDEGVAGHITLRVCIYSISQLK